MLDLFSGIGGFTLAAKEAGIKTVGFCEINSYCQKVLKKNFPEIPIHKDIRKLKKKDINEKIDIITGGFPCQPYSVAGRKEGTQDNRDLWPEMLRVIKEHIPTWVIGENVANFTNMAFKRTKTDLEIAGYEVQPFIIPACAVGAPHARKRIWIVAYTDSKRRCLRHSERENAKNARQSSRHKGNDTGRVGFWDIEPNVGRVANGLSGRMDRLKGLGNAIVPQVVFPILAGIVHCENKLKDKD